MQRAFFAAIKTVRSLSSPFSRMSMCMPVKTSCSNIGVLSVVGTQRTVCGRFITKFGSKLNSKIVMFVLYSNLHNWRERANVEQHVSQCSRCVCLFRSRFSTVSDETLDIGRDIYGYNRSISGLMFDFCVVHSTEQQTIDMSTLMVFSIKQ
jgi:hypothetical protein